MKLAINGGQKTRSKAFPMQQGIGEEEKKAANRVLDNKILSHYRGSYSKYFYGGPEVKALENLTCEKFNVEYAIPTNSCTSSLVIACGAIGLQLGDEVIVTPYSMTCSATAPLHYGAVPIFADVEKDYFCLDPDSIEKKITKKTKAIIVVDLFGLPFDVKRIRQIATKHNLWIIEDAAQGIGSEYNGEHAGTLGDIGCFSFTQGKHLTAGEGGLIVTNNPELAFKSRLIMNHAESVINDMEPSEQQMFYDDLNMVGYNMRMTEIQAAIIQEQLKKLDGFVKMRQDNVKLLYDGICGIYGIDSFPVRENSTHSYYVQPFKYDSDKIGVDRDTFIKAVVAELSGEEGRKDRPMLGNGYIKPLYLMPLFQKRMHYALNYVKKSSYKKGICPVVEKLYEKDLFLSMYHNLPLNKKDIDNIIQAFYKVYENIDELKG